jgi:hypothetical protein
MAALLSSSLLAGCVSDDASDSDKGEQGAQAGDDPSTDDSPDDESTDTTGDDSATDDEPTDVTDPTGDPPATLPVDETAPLVGRFLLTLQAANGDKAAATGFTGNVGDATYPELTIWDEADANEATGCRLLTPRVPNCSAGCGSDACVEDETCVPYPTRHSVGDITVSGVQTTAGGDSITIAPQKPRLDYVKTASMALEYPPAPEGDVLRLTSAGGDYSPLSIEITAIAPLELTSEGTLPLSPDEPLVLHWAAPAAGESMIEVKVDISHHGGAKGKIECKTDDDGELEIPASLTKALIELGVAGFPTVEVTRVARGIGNVEVGRVEFQSISMQDRALEVPGLTSCMSDEDCPEGETCQVTRSCG